MKTTLAEVPKLKLLDIHCINCDFEWFCVEVCRCPQCDSGDIIVGVVK